ncbi:MAG: class I SAM-dependent methyltransferase [archaeon]
MKNYERYSGFVDNWKKAVFPARPSPEEMVVFDNLMSKHEGQSLLILGSTPEFRDLGAKHNLKVTCADINPDMLEGMKQLVKHKNKDENLVKCNWLKMPFEDNTFDIVFAEQSANIIEAEFFDAFFKEVSRVLKKGGFFINKMLVPCSRDEKDILEQFRKERKDIFYLYDHLYHAEGVFDKTTSIGHGHLKPIFDRLLREGKITKEEHSQFFDALGAIIDADLHLNVLKKEKLEPIMRNHFKIKQILFGEDFEKHMNHPIYTLEK